jgi:large conductance mechanosensitive channel
VLQEILNFLVAVAVYVVLVAPTNKLAQMRKQGEEAAPEAPSEEILLLTQIRDLLGGADTTVVGPPTGGAGPDDTPPAAPIR